VCICQADVEGLELSQLTTDSDNQPSSMHHYLALMICNTPIQSCFFSECKECPGPSKAKEILENIFEENYIETATCKQWFTTDINP
jgi:hypothetical protein